MRLAVHTDDAYRLDGDAIGAELAFARFAGGLADFVERLVVLGRLDPQPGPAPHALPAGAEFIALPWFGDLARPLRFARAVPGALWRFWRALAGVDAVWLLGPSPLGIAFAALARARGRAVALGVRMSYPDYVRRRYPGRRGLHLLADALDAAWRALARRCPTVVVGEQLGARYGRARRLLVASISLVEDDELVSEAQALARGYDGELVVLTVGRLDAEKNPMLLADVLARLPGDRWRLVVCGDGPLRDALGARLRELGVADRAQLRGQLPARELRAAYRSSHALLHVSWTEGVPQVLFEAFAAGLPTVATDVGGVRAAAGDAALLVGPGDPDAATAALARVADEPQLRARLTAAALSRAREHTRGAESRRVVDFLEGAATSASATMSGPR
jgi:glycosyltransferase involved in cell wall biosynthesis